MQELPGAILNEPTDDSIRYVKTSKSQLVRYRARAGKHSINWALLKPTEYQGRGSCRSSWERNSSSLIKENGGLSLHQLPWRREKQERNWTNDKKKRRRSNINTKRQACDQCLAYSGACSTVRRRACNTPALRLLTKRENHFYPVR